MDRHQRLGAIERALLRSTHRSDRCRLAQQRMRGRCAQCDGQRRPDKRALTIEPPATGNNLAAVRAGVQSPLSARLELEVLDRVGHVSGAAIDTRIAERAVEQLSRRPDKGLPGQILLIARLFANEHQPCIDRTFAKHRLGCAAMQRAARAFRSVSTQIVPLLQRCSRT